jgi:hypothetical protein
MSALVQRWRALRALSAHRHVPFASRARTHSAPPHQLAAAAARESAPSCAAPPVPSKWLNRQLADAPTASHVLRLCELHASSSAAAPGFNPVNYTTAFSRLARKADGSAAVARDPRFLALVQGVCRELERQPASFDGRALSSIAHAVAKLGGAAHAKALVRQSLHAVERAALLPPPTAAPATAAPTVGDAFELRHLAQLAHAFASAHVSAPSLFGAIARASAAQLRGGDAARARPAEQLDAQALSNLAWAFAKSGVRAPELFGALANAAAVRLPDFSDGELTMLVWALARAHGRPARGGRDGAAAAVGAPAAIVPLLERLDAECERRAPTLGAMQLALLAWSVATLDHPAPRLLARASGAARADASQFDQQALCNLAWALAHAARQQRRRACGEADDDALEATLDAICAAALPRVPQLRNAELAMLSLAFASGGARPRPRAGEAAIERAELLGAIERAVVARADSLGTSDLCSLVYSLARSSEQRGGARARAPAAAALGSLARRASDLLALLEPAELAHVCRAFAHAHAAGGDGARAAARLLFGRLSGWGEAELVRFGPDNLAVLAWALVGAAAQPVGAGAAAGGQAPVLTAIARLALRRLDDFDAAALVTLAVTFSHAHAHAHAAANAAAAADAAARAAAPRAPRARIASAAVAKPDAAADAEVAASVLNAIGASERAAAACARMSGRELCAFACALARPLGAARAPRLWAALAQEICARADAGRLERPEAIAMLAWALATAELGCAAGGAPLGARAAGASRKLPAATVAHAHAQAWRDGDGGGGDEDEDAPERAAARAAPLARPSAAHAAVFEALARCGVARAAELSGQDVCNLSWAFARARQPAHGLLSALAPHAARIVGGLSGAHTDGVAPARDGQMVATLVWAWAHARAPPADARALFAAAAEWGEAHAGALSARELSMTAWAFASARLSAPRLFDALAAEARARAPELACEQLTMIAWAYAVSAVRAPELFVALRAQAARLASELSPKQLARLVWSDAVHDALLPQPARPRAAAAAGCDDRAAIWHEVARRSCAAGAAAPSAADLAAAWTDGQRRALGQAALSARTAAEPRAAEELVVARLVSERPPRDVSDGARRYTQTQLSQLLRARGWAHDDEATLAHGWLVVDMADSRRRVALEFDGPSHFLTDLASERRLVVDGPTVWKSRALQALGWRVVRVRFDEWARAQGADRDAFLDQLIAQIDEPGGAAGSGGSQPNGEEWVGDARAGGEPLSCI